MCGRTDMDPLSPLAGSATLTSYADAPRREILGLRPALPSAAPKGPRPLRAELLTRTLARPCC